MSFLNIVVQYSDAMWGGLKVTLQLSIVVWAAGLILGTGLGALGAVFKSWVGYPSKVFSILLAGMPALVFLFWMHYPFQSTLGIVVAPFITAALTLSVINVFMVADLVRGAINDLPRQYSDAARVCGITSRDTIVHIQLPILLRQVLPGLLLIQIALFQMTIFASLISVDEIFRVSQRINAQIYRPVEIYTLLAAFFVAVCVPMHVLAQWLRTRFTRDFSER